MATELESKLPPLTFASEDEDTNNNNDNNDTPMRRVDEGINSSDSDNNNNQNEMELDNNDNSNTNTNTNDNNDENDTPMTENKEENDENDINMSSNDSDSSNDEIETIDLDNPDLAEISTLTYDEAKKKEKLLMEIQKQLTQRKMKNEQRVVKYQNRVNRDTERILNGNQMMNILKHLKSEKRTIKAGSITTGSKVAQIQLNKRSKKTNKLKSRIEKESSKSASPTPVISSPTPTKSKSESKSKSIVRKSGILRNNNDNNDKQEKKKNYQRRTFSDNTSIIPTAMSELPSNEEQFTMVNFENDDESKDFMKQWKDNKPRIFKHLADTYNVDDKILQSIVMSPNFDRERILYHCIKHFYETDNIFKSMVQKRIKFDEKTGNFVSTIRSKSKSQSKSKSKSKLRTKTKSRTKTRPKTNDNNNDDEPIGKRLTRERRKPKRLYDDNNDDTSENDEDTNENEDNNDDNKSTSVKKEKKGKGKRGRGRPKKNHNSNDNKSKSVKNDKKGKGKRGRPKKVKTDENSDESPDEEEIKEFKFNNNKNLSREDKNFMENVFEKSNLIDNNNFTGFSERRANKIVDEMKGICKKNGKKKLVEKKIGWVILKYLSVFRYWEYMFGENDEITNDGETIISNYIFKNGLLDIGNNGVYRVIQQMIKKDYKILIYILNQHKPLKIKNGMWRYDDDGIILKASNDNKRFFLSNYHKIGESPLFKVGYLMDMSALSKVYERFDVEGTDEKWQIYYKVSGNDWDYNEKTDGLNEWIHKTFGVSVWNGKIVKENKNSNDNSDEDTDEGTDEDTDTDSDSNEKGKNQRNKGKKKDVKNKVRGVKK